MTDTLERELRRTLADHAPDPAEHRSRPVGPRAARRRGAPPPSRAGAVAGSLALAVALGGGLAVVQPWAGGEPTQPPAVEVVAVPAAWAALDDGTPRGELGSDDRRPGGRGGRPRRARPRSTTAGRWSPAPLRLLFAGDVGRQPRGGGGGGVRARGRPRRSGGRRWSVPEGAAVADLAGGRAGHGRPLAAGRRSWSPWVVSRTPRLVALVPRGAEVSVSDAASVAADGVGEPRVARAPRWRTASSTPPWRRRDGFGKAVLRLDSVRPCPPVGRCRSRASPGRRPGPTPRDAQAMAERAAEVVGRGQEARADRRPRGRRPAPRRGRRGGLVAAAGYAPEARTGSCTPRRTGPTPIAGPAAGRRWSHVRTGDGAVVSWSVHADGGSTPASTLATVGAADARRAAAPAGLCRTRDRPDRHLGPARHPGHGQHRRRGRVHAAGRRLPVVPGRQPAPRSWSTASRCLPRPRRSRRSVALPGEEPAGAALRWSGTDRRHVRTDRAVRTAARGPGTLGG